MSSPASVVHGPGLIGTFLNVLLYGIMLMQCFMYYSRYPSDASWLKLFVLALLVADTANCIFDIWWIYGVLIRHFGNSNALTTANWVFATDPAMVGMIATSVQLFFAWRVKVLSGNLWLVVFIVVGSMTNLFGAIATATAIHFVPEFKHFQEFQAVVIVWLMGTTVCDITITLSLTWHLSRNRTGFQQTDDLLKRVIRHTVQTGLITSICATADLIAFLVSPSGIHLAFNIPLAKLYTNSLISTLNARPSWRYQSTTGSLGVKSPVHDSGSSTSRKLDVGHLPSFTKPEIYVTVESHKVVDKADIDRGDSSKRERSEKTTQTTVIIHPGV